MKKWYGYSVKNINLDIRKCICRGDNILDNTMSSRFTNNLLFAFLAQGISLIFSILMSLLVPKLLGVEQYAYWQLFIFYSTYVGFFHFGLSDGIYLKYGGVELESMDKTKIGSQFKLMVLWQILICIITLPILIVKSDNGERQFVWVIVALYLVVANATWYLGYVFQAANRTSIYSISIIISKTVYILFILFSLKLTSFKPFILFYLLAQGVSFIYVFFYGREFVFAKMLPIKKTIQEAIGNIKIGINLTISAISSSLILGIGRAMVDRTEGISSFGLLSLSISLTNFFLQFIAQISMVLFPALRQADREKARTLFLYMREGISFLLCGILIFYIPAKMFLQYWLPDYKKSMEYMVFLLPICISDGKMQMLYNTYLKVYRKERGLLLINIVSLGISATLCAIGAFGFRSIIAVAIGMATAITSRSIIANAYLSKVMRVTFDNNLIFEIVLTIIFIISNIMMPEWIAFFTYLICYVGYLMIRKKAISELSIFLGNIYNKRKHNEVI